MRRQRFQIRVSETSLFAVYYDRLNEYFELEYGEETNSLKMIEEGKFVIESTHAEDAVARRVEVEAMFLSETSDYCTP